MQKEFNQEVLLAALALCFNEYECLLSVEQILTRDFTPDASYSKLCINQLLLEGAIQCAAGVSVSVGGKARQLINVRRPERMGGPLHKFITHVLNNLKVALEEHASCIQYLESLRHEVESCECIQYAKFFASRDNLRIVDASPDVTKFHLLLMENSHDQIFMLLWRSIKTHSEGHTNKTGDISFSKLIGTAFEFYLNYKAKGITIDSYEWPKRIPISKLASVIRVLKR